MLAIVACGAIAPTPQTQPSLTQKLIQRVVKSTKGHADAAANLLAAAKSLQDDPKVQVAFCEAAYEYGIKAAGGLGSAVEALDMLDKIDAKRAATWAQKRTVIYRLRYTLATGKDKRQHGQSLVTMLLKAGDEKSKQHNMTEAVALYRGALTVAKYLKLPEREYISQKLIAAVHLLKVQSDIDRLKAKLAANPGDKAARVSLIHTYLLALDSPAEAAKYLSDNCDESLRKFVPLAAKPLAELKEADCLALAQWYDQLIVKGTTPTSKANAAGRAVRYYLQFLSLHKAKDVMAVGGRLALQSLQDRIKKLGLKLPGGAAGADATAPSAGGTGLVFSLGRGSTGTGLKPREAARVYRGEMIFTRGAVISTAGKAVYEACKRTNELTVEATITPGNLTQSGPARIITLSSTGLARNFTVGQEGANLVLRLRTTRNGTNGSKVEPKLCKLRTDRAQRVVITYRPGQLSCYVDGKLAMKTGRIQGDFSNWDSKQTLLFGDERDDHRYWTGRLKDVKIHSRALSPDQAARSSSP